MTLALININQLLTVPSGGGRVKTGAAMRELGVVANGAVLIEGAKITWTGRMEDLSMGSLREADVLDCLDKVVMPGFVDPHTHLVFAGSREEDFARRIAGATYAEIAAAGGGILDTVRHVRAASKKDLKKAARRHLHRVLHGGTTTVEIKTGYGLDTDTELRMLEAINELASEEVIGIVTTFLGAHALPPEYGERRRDFVHEVTERMIPYIGTKGLAAFCDVFCDEGYFTVEESREILTQGKRFGLAPKLHAEELTHSGSAELAAELGAVSADHLEHVGPEGIAALAQAGVVATLLPGVSFFLDHPYAPGRALVDAGVPVALATDFNPGSCMSYSMPLMMTIAATHMGLSPEEVITASTFNAAASVGRSHEIGSLEPGKKADLVVLDLPNYKHLPYHFGENHVERVVKDGVVLEF